MLIIGNVVLPMLMPHLMVAVAFLVVLPLEWGVTYAYQRKSLGVGKVLWMVAAANVVSLVAGSLFAVLLPLEPPYSASFAATYLVFVSVGYLIAFLLSWWIEYLFIKRVGGKYELPRLKTTVGVANLLSYAVLLAYLGLLG